jgi:hypothetical protein
MSRVHEIKCDEPHFTDVSEGRKRFEVRFWDRDYRIGDFLELVSTRTAKRIRVEVLHMLPGDEYCTYGIRKGWVIMSIRLTGWEGQNELPAL